MQDSAVAMQVGASGGAGVGNGVGSAFELAFWESVASSNDRAQLEAYLTQYPNGTFSGLARAKIAALPPVAPVPAGAAPVTTSVATATVMAVPAPAAPAASASAAPAAARPAPAAPVPVAAATVVVTTATAPGTASAATPATPGAPAGMPPAAAAAVAAAAAAATAAIAPAGSGAGSLLDQFTALGKGSDMTAAPALFTETGPVPPRPNVTPMAPPAIPDHFCSAVERNSFHDRVYVPAVAQADRINEAAIGHMKNVQSLHAAALTAKNIPGANALAREATAFKPYADQAYEARIAMTDLFGRIMAVPITGC